MLHFKQTIRKSDLTSNDGSIGEVKDVYFSDDSWKIRYFVVDTGLWLPGRKVLISPAAVHEFDTASGALAVDLTRNEVKNSPPVDTDAPVSRRKEGEINAYFGWPAYWSPGFSGFPINAPVGTPETDVVNTSVENSATSEQPADPKNSTSTLRSAAEVIGYKLAATDGDLGHIEDLLFDEREWQMAHVEIDTKNWWPGKHVLLPTDAIADIHWSSRHIEVKVDRDTIKAAPAYDKATELSTEFLDFLEGYYEPCTQVETHTG